MRRNLLEQDDLVENPTARVPVCLCLDTSESMRAVYGGVTAIDELMAGVNTFYDAIRDDEVAMYSAEMCIVTFGGRAELIEDFACIERQPSNPVFRASGGTPMGEAVNLALDCLETRKKEYRDKGVDYFQPWLVLMTDGEPNGSAQELDRAIKRIQELVKSKKLVVFPIGIGGDADMNVLGLFSPGRTPLKLQGINFKAFFQWLSQSVSRTSQSMPGEKITLDMEGIKGWGEL